MSDTQRVHVVIAKTQRRFVLGFLLASVVLLAVHQLGHILLGLFAFFTANRLTKHYRKHGQKVAFPLYLRSVGVATFNCYFYIVIGLMAVVMFSSSKALSLVDYDKSIIAGFYLFVGVVLLYLLTVSVLMIQLKKERLPVSGHFHTTLSFVVPRCYRFIRDIPNTAARLRRRVRAIKRLYAIRKFSEQSHSAEVKQAITPEFSRKS
ncbi:hypothetical protein [Vibrio sp. Hal054]|uniref:hypothetical protein n=1 Tax=Vibrio sp. Hal054 TaxID=3035158 RepID=UPI00301C8488